MSATQARQRRIVLGLAAVITLMIAAVLIWRAAAGDGEAKGEDIQADGADPRVATQDRFGDRSDKAPAKPNLGGAAKATVSGTIHDPAGKPIANAQVCVFANSVELRGFGNRRGQCARSGPDGHYRVEGLWPVKAEIHASAPTYQPNRWERRVERNRLETELPLRAGQVAEGVDIELEPGGVLVRGIVKDIAGGGIEGAQVKLSGGWLSPIRGIAVVFSDEDGQFETWTAPAVIEVSATVDGYAPGEVSAIAPGEFVELFLTPESVLIGKVVLASNGDPVAGAMVSASGSSYGGRGNSTQTDADGQFRINELEPGIYKPTVESDELYGQLAEQVHLGLGETSNEVVIRVHPAVYVEGQVMVAGTKQACPDASVRLANEGVNNERDRADDAGQVEFRGVLAGTYEVSVRCEGYVPANEYPELIVGEDNIVGLVWEVSEGHAIRGEVVDEAGEPVAFVNVSASPITEPDAARTQMTNVSKRSEDDGSFELAGLLPGRYEVSTSSWRGRPGPLDPVTVELDSGADVNDVQIVMPSVGTIRGRVIDESGTPVSGAGLSASLIGGRGEGTSRTNDAGEFEIKDLRPGPTRVTPSDGGSWWGGGTAMRKPGTDDDDEQGEVVEVVGNEVVEVVLTVEARSGTITGVVTDEAGGPVADAFVDVERKSDKAGANAAAARRSVRWSWDKQPLLTDQDGRFELTGLPEGTFLVRANRKGGGEAIAEDVALGSHVALVIASTGELAGTVTLTGGKAPERFTVTAQDKASGIYLSDSLFRTQGVWRFREVPAGKYEIVASAAEGTVTLEPELELGEGEVREKIELVLAPRLTLRGRIVDLETREPVAGLEVYVSGSGNYMFGGNNGEHLNVSGPDGSFEVEDAPIGSVYLMAWNRAAGSKAKYESLWQAMKLEAEPLVQDVGELEVVARRLEPNESPGDLGYELNDWDPTAKPEDWEPIVALVRPGGPADGTGLEPGDVIEKVQGYEVLGTRSSRYRQLTQLPKGSKLKLEIRGGKTVEITMGPAIQ